MNDARLVPRQEPHPLQEHGTTRPSTLIRPKRRHAAAAAAAVINARIRYITALCIITT